MYQLGQTDSVAQGLRSGVRVGLIGCGITRSRTPGMHMAEAKAQGFDVSYAILDMDEPTHSGMTLETMLDRVEAEGFAGVNITYPYKIEATAHLDGLSANAEAVGAVNTVIFRDGRRMGHNTDLWGFAEGFRRGLAQAPRDHVLLLGGGGAGVAVAHALAGSLAVKRLSIFDVDAARARALADRVARRWGIAAAGVTDLAAVARETLDGVINATPMGMARYPGSAFPGALMRPSLWVYDIVYVPLETEFLRLARAAGCTAQSGADMAVFQAVRAFELFTGRPADPTRMRATFDAFDTPKPLG